MRRRILLGLSLALFMPFASFAAPPAKTPSYVVFNVRGNCPQEDCPAMINNVLLGDELKYSIISISAPGLIIHTEEGDMDAKPVYVYFRDLKTAPVSTVVDRLQAIGYDVVSYVMHDTSKGKDTIIEHN